MSNFMPFLRIEKELPSQLHLVSPNRRWLILVIAVIAATPMVCLGLLAFTDEKTLLIGGATILFGLSVLAAILFTASYKSVLIINSGMRTVTINQHYWLGESIREKSWSFNEITDTNMVKQGMANLIEVKANRKKVLRLNFGGKTEEAKRSHHLLQSWLKGLTPESNAATTALQAMADEKQGQQFLKNAEKLLYYFGGFSLLGGVLGFFTNNTLTSTISIATIISLVTGILYLACGFGAKHKIEAALWIAIFIVLAERLYWFIMSGTLNGDGTWSAWLTWIFAFFVVSSLWKAIQSIRAMDEDPVYEPLA